MGLKGPQRAAMFDLSPDRKRYLLRNIRVDNSPEEMQPLQPQNTGGWSSWWISSGGDKSNLSNKDAANAAKWYVDGIRSGNATSPKLVKHLISLRVHLSTAKPAWIEGFICEDRGFDALSELLASLVGKGGKKKALNDVQSSVLLEAIKCLRVLLNTEVGRNSSPPCSRLIL
jgi:diaphanous 1